MTTQPVAVSEINKVLAEKLMGWLGSFGAWYAKPHQMEFVMSMNLWNPCENIEQAFMCLEKLGQIDRRIRFHSGYLTWTCDFPRFDERFGDHNGPYATAETPSEAIARACHAAITKAGDE